MRSKMNEIILGNCIEVMKTFEDKSFDLILTDPPYNAKNIGPNARKYDVGTMQLPALEYQKFCHDWFKEANRVAKTIVFTPGIANVCYYPQPDWIACWHKPAAVSFNRFGGFNAWEPIMLYGKIAKGKHLGQDYIKFNTLNFTKGIEKEHPCPKPVELMKFFIDRFMENGGTVLDPFMGSGTTGVAARQLGQNFVGIEISEKYVEIARKRLESVTPGMF
jgi:site-specific DNA-methyltransferase (adenine-specific)